MKRLVFLAVVALFLMVPAVMAGDYHMGSGLTCAECHVMHAEQHHGYNANGGGNYTTIGPDAPYEYLLRNKINDLCLSCHDGATSAPDVLDGNTPGPAVRQAGALNRDGSSPYYKYDGHTLDTVAVAPGGTWRPDTAGLEVGLNCANCHEPHGDPGVGNPDTVLGQYRNLVSDPGGASDKWVNYAVVSNDPTKAVYERLASGSSHYSYTNVDFNEPLTDGSHYGAWCQGCHTDFHGKQGDANMGGTGGEEWLRHPTADANIGALGGGHSSKSVFAGRANKVKVMTATGNWNPSTSGDVTDHTPSCFSCHKGHGNKNAFGLIFMSGTGTVTEEGDAGTAVRNLCKQCHGQGG